MNAQQHLQAQQVQQLQQQAQSRLVKNAKALQKTDEKRNVLKFEIALDGQSLVDCGMPKMEAHKDFVEAHCSTLGSNEFLANMRGIRNLRDLCPTTHEGDVEAWSKEWKSIPVLKFVNDFLGFISAMPEDQQPSAKERFLQYLTEGKVTRKYLTEWKAELKDEKKSDEDGGEPGKKGDTYDTLKANALRFIKGQLKFSDVAEFLTAITERQAATTEEKKAVNQ